MARDRSLKLTVDKSEDHRPLALLQLVEDLDMLHRKFCMRCSVGGTPPEEVYHEFLFNLAKLDLFQTAVDILEVGQLVSGCGKTRIVAFQEVPVFIDDTYPQRDDADFFYIKTFVGVRGCRDFTIGFVPVQLAIRRAGICNLLGNANAGGENAKRQGSIAVRIIVSCS